ncbi:hypothetical protein [Gemmobacter sp. 24YEA27]|uniref:hypothetical protein n=1 Tax=Gemmobacter sp. 24YEA27 TaxID=3040672 RepID=UPI0024B37ED3|nr:hypothetical protein [Gemmobacter sp. 24YEA27]
MHTESLSVAKTKEEATWEQVLAARGAKLAGDSTDPKQRYAAACDLAETLHEVVKNLVG